MASARSRLKGALSDRPLRINADEPHLLAIALQQSMVVADQSPLLKDQGDMVGQGKHCEDKSGRPVPVVNRAPARLHLGREVWPDGGEQPDELSRLRGNIVWDPPQDCLKVRRQHR